jgi:hypothetical protein
VYHAPAKVRIVPIRVRIIAIRVVTFEIATGVSINRSNGCRRYAGLACERRFFGHKGTDNRNKGTDNRNQGTDNRNQGTDNRNRRYAGLACERRFFGTSAQVLAAIADGSVDVTEPYWTVDSRCTAIRIICTPFRVIRTPIRIIGRKSKFASSIPLFALSIPFFELSLHFSASPIPLFAFCAATRAVAASRSSPRHVSSSACAPHRAGTGYK